MGKTIGLVAATLVLTLLGSAGARADVDLDRTFSGDGKVTTGFGSDVNRFGVRMPRVDRAFASAVQPDGRLVVAGTSRCGLGECSELAMVRYRVNGRLDPSFGNKGKLRLPIGALGSIEDIEIMPDGRILMVGRVSTEVGSPSRMLIARLNADGSYDESFNGVGYVLQGDYDGRDEMGALSLDMVGDGSALVAGWRSCEAGCREWLYGKFTSEGGLDPEFFEGSLVSENMGNNGQITDPEDLSTSIDTDSRGRVIVVGADGPKWMVATRMTPDGQTDLSFGDRGYSDFAAFPGGGSREPLKRKPTGVAIAANDSIYVSASRQYRYGNQGDLIHIFENGELDVSFGGGRGLAPTGRFAPEDVILDRCGRIVVAGTWLSGFDSAFSVSRFHANGVVDRSFAWHSPHSEEVGLSPGATASSVRLHGRRVQISGSAYLRKWHSDFAVVTLKIPRRAFRCAR